MKKGALSTFFLFGCAFLVSAQSQHLSFDVASIKISPPSAPMHARSTGLGAVAQDPEMISLRQISLTSLLMRAYGLKQFQISGPNWMDAVRYDVSAKLPEGATEEQIPEMLQQLIMERFRMTVRWDTAQASAYALIVGKDGPKLTVSAADSAADAQLPPDKARSINLSSADPVKLNGATTAALADFLSRVLAVPVTDSTGLQGRFDITLNIPYKDLLAAQGLSASPSADTSYTPSSLFDAVRDIGLLLQPQKIKIKKLIVVHADRVPVEN